MGEDVPVDISVVTSGNEGDNKSETAKELKEYNTEEGQVGGVGAKGEEIKKVHMEGEQVEGEGDVEAEQAAGEHIAGEHVEGEDIASEHVEGEHVAGEHVEGEEKVEGEELEGEQQEGEEKSGKEEAVAEEIVDEEYMIPEEPPPDPTAPYNLTDSSEALKAPFKLSDLQQKEVQELWNLFQDYTPAYSDINGYITEKELVYMLHSLNLMTYTPEQLQELIEFCVRPPHPEGHIDFESFVKIVTIRQRDMPIEEELRLALLVMDKEKSGMISRDLLTEVLGTMGRKLNAAQVNNFVREVDMTNDGTIGVEDVVGTLCIDLGKDEILMMMEQINPPQEEDQTIDKYI